jgi:phosphoglycolate phosphatase
MNDKQAGHGVVLDIDGTLADTPGVIGTLTAEVLRGLGETPDEQAITATVGQPLEANFARFLNTSRDDPRVLEAVGEYRRLFGAHLREEGAALLYPGVADGLAALADAGLLLGVATSKIEAAGAAMVKLTGLSDFISVVAGDDTVERGKPNADMALYVAERLGLAPESCTVVGDSVGDMRMAVAAGMRAVGVGYGVATPTELREAGADAVADSFPELVALLTADAKTEH